MFFYDLLILKFWENIELENIFFLVLQNIPLQNLKKVPPGQQLIYWYLDIMVGTVLELNKTDLFCVY